MLLLADDITLYVKNPEDPPKKFVGTDKFSKDWYRKTNKEDVVYIYNGILLSHRKEWNLAICDNTDGPSGYYAQGNVKHHMISLIYGIYIKKINKPSRERKKTDGRC